MDMLGGPSDVPSPAMFLTKICIVSSASTDEARENAEDIDEKLLERISAGACIMFVEVRKNLRVKQWQEWKG